MRGVVRAKLVQQHLRPDGNAQVALGGHPGGGWRSEDALVLATGASRAIALSTDDASMRLDFYLQDLAVLGARERLEGQAASGATTLVGRQIKNLLHTGQSRVIAAFGTGFVRLL